MECRTGKPVELSFFPVPNIDEVQFGTAINKAFGTEVAKDLGMGEYKPGSTIRTYLVQYCNIYWAKKASGVCVVIIASRQDGGCTHAQVNQYPRPTEIEIESSPRTPAFVFGRFLKTEGGCRARV